jgi:hypothetical protein
MPALNGMTERRETSDLQPRTEDKPIKLTPGTAGVEITELLAWADIPRARYLYISNSIPHIRS